MMIKRSIPLCRRVATTSVRAAVSSTAAEGGRWSSDAHTWKVVPVVGTAMAVGGMTLCTVALAEEEETTQVAWRPKPKVVFVLGGPGAGKGTQCGKIVKDYGFRHLSAGDLLRAERDSGSPQGDLIQSYIKEGQIVPVEITVKLLKRAMMESPETKFLVDGFPRNFDNLQGWERVMGDSVDVECVLFYEAPEEVLEKRLLARGASSGRTDDNLETIRKRFRVFLESTVPVVDVYGKQGKVRRICSNASVEDVFEDTKRVVEPIVKEELLELNQALLDGISEGNLELYKDLCADDLSAFEAESDGMLVEGLDFHEFYLTRFRDLLAADACPVPRMRNVMLNPHVRFMGNSAVISYVRVVQRFKQTKSFSETRVWQVVDGKWKNVHFHRSPMGAAARPPLAK